MTNIAMPTNARSRRFLLVELLGTLFVPIAAAQQPATAQAFLEGIYRPYLRKGYEGPPAAKYGEIFVPDLAQAIDRDFKQAERKGEVPTLSGDAFLDADGPDPIANLVVTATVNGSKATGAVGFVIQSPAHGVDRRQLTIDLVQTPAGWRIHDIASKRDFPNETLRGIFKLRR